MCRTLAGVIATGVAIVTLCVSAQAAPHPTTTQSFTFDASRVRIEGAMVRWVGEASVNAAAAGHPDLPSVVRIVELPADQRAVEVIVDHVETISLGTHDVQPARADHRADMSPNQRRRDPDAYRAASHLPKRWATLQLQGSMRGHRLATVEIHPVRWNPATGELIAATELSITIVTETDPSAAPLTRHRIVPATEERFRAYASRAFGGVELAGGPESGVELAGGPESAVDPAGPGPYQPTFRPTTDGSPVEYVIVTSDLLAPEFQRLADWKMQKGVRTVVRTVEWIDDTYPNGVDAAERLRFFIQDAYQNWGVLWVLLGGDTDQVPFRYAYSSLFDGENIPADYYFSCLEGNWNADADALFGEAQIDSLAGDEVDLLPEVYVGRAPASTVVEAQTFVDKILLYERDTPAGNGYPASALYAAERLFGNIHGADIAETAVNTLPSGTKVVKLYEESASYPGSIELSREATIDSVNNGFGLVHHVGHGYRNTMSLSDFSMSNANADNLTNAERQSFVFAINCSSVSIDFNTIGERWIKNPNGGAFGYYGTSRYAFVSSATFVQDEWYTAWTDTTTTESLGELCTLGRATLLPFSNTDGTFRWTVFALSLLGDPEMTLFMRNPEALEVAHADSLTIGNAPLALTVTHAGTPVEGATVAAWSASGTFARATTDVTGTANLFLNPEASGAVLITATHPNTRAYQASIEVVAPADALPYVELMEIDDDTLGNSQGDADGIADVGETLEISLFVRNRGGAPLTNATGTLSLDDPAGHVTLENAQVSYGDIAAAAQSSGIDTYRLALDLAAPEAYQPIMTLTIVADQGTFTDELPLAIHRPYVEHHAHSVDDSAGGNADGQAQAGEQFFFAVESRNTGPETSYGLGATARVLNRQTGAPEPLATVADSTAVFGDLAYDETAVGDPFDVTLDAALDIGDVWLEITFTDQTGEARVDLVDLVTPAAPDSLTAFGSPTSITLTWRPPADTDVLGYDVYRADSPGGTFTRVNHFIAQGSARYEDANLPGLTQFYYQVVARDSSFNASEPSLILGGTTNPTIAAGWPVELGQSSTSSVKLADVDADGDIEVFAASDLVYGWHGDATEIIDGDEDARTNGPLNADGYDDLRGYNATTALGDVDGDGQLELCNVSWTTREVFLWDNTGETLPGWPKALSTQYNWASPVLVDLDLDEDLEVVAFPANGGRLYAWHHDGTEVFDGDQNPATDGVLRVVDGTLFNYSSPAVANLDQDPEPEIVISTNLYSGAMPRGAVYAINPDDGSDVPGWPVHTGDGSNPSQVSSSAAIGDLDDDGFNEVIVASERSGGRLHVLRADGTDQPGWPVAVASTTPQARQPSPVVADIDWDGKFDVIYAATDGKLWVFDSDAVVRPGFPVIYRSALGTAQATESTPSVGNIDSDIELEILFGDESAKLHAFNHDGTEAAGFPIQLNAEVRSTPALGDVDDDGFVDVALCGWDANVYVWELPTSWVPTLNPWPSFRRDINNTGYFERVDVTATQEPQATPAPLALALHGANPNPFNPTTAIDFDVPAGVKERVRLDIYDVSGRLVRTLVDGVVQPGQHSAVWDGSGHRGPAQSGTYFAQLRVGRFTQSRKLVLLK